MTPDPQPFDGVLVRDEGPRLSNAEQIAYAAVGALLRVGYFPDKTEVNAVDVTRAIEDLALGDMLPEREMAAHDFKREITSRFAKHGLRVLDIQAGRNSEGVFFWRLVWMGPQGVRQRDVEIPKRNSTKGVGALEAITAILRGTKDEV